MKNIFDSAYRSHYLEGYAIGSDPHLEPSTRSSSEAFRTGFYSGRLHYETLNGPLGEGIPNKILTNAVLEDFMFSGMLGMSIDLAGYTDFQVRTIGKWYMSGVEKYDPYECISLFAYLEKIGIYVQP